MKMFLPIAIAFLAHLAGVLLGLGGRRRSLAALRTFALVSALAVVLGQLLPDALGGMGLWALAVFGVFSALPSLVDKLAARIGRRSGALGLELGYIALAVHQVADGLALGAYGGHAHEGHGHGDVLLALSAHTVPLAALVALAYLRRANVRVAVLRVTGLFAATLGGIIATSLVPAAAFERFEPWITAAVAGLLLHVVVHDWEPERAPAGTGERLVDLVAVGAGVGLVLLGGHDHHDGGGVRAPIGEALWELSLAAAPALLFGLVVGAFASAWSAGRVPARWLGGGPFRQAAVGATIGAPMPICACNVLPRAAALRSRGAGPALVVAFLIATPALGVETFALTGRLIGWPFALVRLFAAVALAMLAGLLVHRVARGEGGGDAVEEAPASPPSSFGARFVECFDALLVHIAPWMVVGLVVAAYVQATLGAGALAGVGAYGLVYLVVTLVAAPSYVCAAAATPLAAVLLGKGMSPGAVLVGLLLASTANIAVLRLLRARYGLRGAVLTVAALVVGGWALALAVDASTLTVLPASLGGEGGRDGLAHALAALLGLLLLRSIWRVGVRGWLASVGEPFGAEPGHVHPHPPHHHPPPAHPIPEP